MAKADGLFPFPKSTEALLLDSGSSETIHYDRASLLGLPYWKSEQIQNGHSD
jgi:hypothetical protein